MWEIKKLRKKYQKGLGGGGIVIKKYSLLRVVSWSSKNDNNPPPIIFKTQTIKIYNFLFLSFSFLLRFEGNISGGF